MICFGEILWDCLPTGKVLGGALLNMTVQMHNLGLKPLIISAVGDDVLGDELLEDIDNLGLDRSHVARLGYYPTSTVDIILDEKGVPTYDIKMPVAWDAIPISDSLLEIAAQTGVIYGTMAQRMDDQSRKSLDKLLEHSKLNFFDANFRFPFTSKELVLKYLPAAHIFKINEAEFPVVLDWLSIDLEEDDAMSEVVNRFDLDVFILTKGAKGSKVFDGSIFVIHPGHKVEVDDTVGCGDAFTAGFVYGTTQNWPLKQTVEFASATSAVVAKKKGGCCSSSLAEVRALMNGNIQ